MGLALRYVTLSTRVNNRTEVTRSMQLSFNFKRHLGHSCLKYKLTCWWRPAGFLALRNYRETSQGAYLPSRSLVLWLLLFIIIHIYFYFLQTLYWRKPYPSASSKITPMVGSDRRYSKSFVFRQLHSQWPVFRWTYTCNINKVDFHSRAIYGERIKLIVVHDTPNNMTVVASTKLCYVMSLERFTLFIYLGALTLSHTPCLLLHIPDTHFRCFLIFLTSSIYPSFIPYSFLSFQWSFIFI
jgi:hypothetical protein